jgi:hypothetical protein
MYLVTLIFEEDASSIAYFSDYVHVFLPDDGRIQLPKHVEK